MDNLQRASAALLLSVLGLVGACEVMPNTPQLPLPTTVCEMPRQIGHFNTASDLFIGHFDSKPDVDDLHTIAAIGSLLSSPGFEYVEAIGVAGTYGTQGGEFIPSPGLFKLAFGNSWVSAHDDNPKAVSVIQARVSSVLASGGDVWIMEAGQSDFSAAVLRSLLTTYQPETLRTRIHIVQHSNWNEGATTPEDLDTTKRLSDYIKIADGNSPDNGTPDFYIPESHLWPDVLANPRIGPIWTEAKHLADLHNPTSAYVNPAVEAGGMDFSDTAEAAYIFGFEDLPNAAAFFSFITDDEGV